MQEGQNCIISGMIRAVCCVPVSPLRAEATHKAEKVSQQLFGECCEILEEAGD